MQDNKKRRAAKRVERIRTLPTQPAIEAPAVRDSAKVVSISTGDEANTWESFKKLQADIFECRRIIARLERVRDLRLADFIAEAAESKVTDDQIATLQQTISSVRGFWA